MKNLGKIGLMVLFLIPIIGHSFLSVCANGAEDTPNGAEDMPKFDIINNWLVPVSTSITLLITAIGGWLSLREYRLKVRAEIRLTESTELESDIKLLKLITEIIDIAHARGGNHVSEKAIEKILSPDVLEQLRTSGANIGDFLETSIMSLPVGFAAQDAAISAIWVLGKKHPILTQVAIQALESIALFKGEVANGYLKDLTSKYKEKNLAGTEKWRQRARAER